MLLRNGSQNADMVTASTDEFGKFCFEVAPGVYRIEVFVYFIKYVFLNYKVCVSITENSAEYIIKEHKYTNLWKRNKKLLYHRLMGKYFNKTLFIVVGSL